MIGDLKFEIETNSYQIPLPLLGQGLGTRLTYPTLMNTIHRLCVVAILDYLCVHHHWNNLSSLIVESHMIYWEAHYLLCNNV